MTPGSPLWKVGSSALRGLGMRGNGARPSLPTQQQIDHPAAADVRSRPAEVRQDVVAIAAGVFQRVRQDGEAVGFEGAGGGGKPFVGGVGPGPRGGGGPAPTRGGGGGGA